MKIVLYGIQTINKGAELMLYAILKELEQIGIPAYLMDFGFGGFLGYGRRVSCCVGEEELNRCDM